MRRPVLLVLVLSGLIAGCATPAPGAPPSASSSASAAPTPLPRVVLPPRPRDVDLAGVDACTLLTDRQRHQLEFDQPWVRNDFISPVYGNNPVRGCTVRSQARGVYVGFEISDHVGMEAWTTGEINGTVEPSSVAGFPAVLATATGQTGFCTAVVDVGPHVALDVQFSLVGKEPVLSLAQLCDAAKGSAELAMTTLTTTLGR